MKHYIDASGEEWLRRFESIREEFLEKVSRAAKDHDVETFRFLSLGTPRASVPIDGALEFLAHRIDDGMCVGFAVARAKSEHQAEIWITSWEPDEPRPGWPSSLTILHSEAHDGVYRVSNAQNAEGA